MSPSTLAYPSLDGSLVFSTCGITAAAWSPEPKSAELEAPEDLLRRVPRQDPSTGSRFDEAGYP